MADANTLFDLNGKIALVTGGNRGLGRAMVLAFRARGADVVIASRKLAVCEEAADEVRRVTGRRALPVACHVGDWHQVERLVETTYREFGRIDILVNNAGMSPVYDRSAFKERARTDIPLGRGGEADEIVGAALYFALNASSFTTGAILGVHGGVA
jgi:NAD(P)-dependent dehydrogenase (short-subunit alcohol dehydrogenase family)